MEHLNKQDRRVLRTKQLLWDAFVKLILKKGYDAVTIQDIIDEANVGRSTFYSHYESKENLLLGAQSHLADMFLNESRDGQINFKLMYQHAKENRKVAKAILGKKGGGILTKHIREVISFKLEKQFSIELAAVKDKDYELAKLKLMALSAALHSLLVNWIESNMNLSVKDMAELSNEFMEINRLNV